MTIIDNTVEVIFNFALFINAALFIFQAVKIFKEKSADDISLSTFLGFLLIQVAIAAHGFINHDYALVLGYFLSILTCSSVVVLILIYGNNYFSKPKKFDLNEAIERLPAYIKPEFIKHLEMLENIIAMMPGNVYWMNNEGIYLGCNDNEAKAVGLMSRKEIIGKRNIDIQGFVIPDVLDSINKEVIAERKTIVIEEPAVLRDGSEAIFLSSKSPLLNDKNEAVGLVGISIDITERKKMEKQLREAIDKAEIAEKAKTEFLYNMRHDIRTPFSGILSMTEYLEKNETDPQKKEYLGDIVKSADVLLQYLNDIMELIHLEDGQQPVVQRKFNLHALLHDVINLNTPSSKDKKLNFYLNQSENLPRYVIGDSLRTKRILINLISNGIKFTEKGYVKLGARLIEQSDNKSIIEFVIEDTGIGIPADKKDVIFEKFNRLTSSYSGVYPGHGLGLRIVRQFLDEMNGEIELESEVGKGSIFTVLIPYKLPLVLEH